MGIKAFVHAWELDAQKCIPVDPDVRFFVNSFSLSEQFIIRAFHFVLSLLYVAFKTLVYLLLDLMLPIMEIIRDSFDN